jgi:NAD(P) transhydrogenase subunit alpha
LASARLLDALAAKGVTAFAMEFVPRITRAQVMDVLSSQANLAGYRAVIEAAEAYGRAMPMMMTAAGTVAPAKVFIMGVGVAGLQAIATARRLGAVVTATDVRPATKEQVESLGAKFVAVEDEEFKNAETAGGYAKEMSAGIPGQAGRAGRRPHQEAGHRHHHRPDPRPPGAQAGQRRAGRLDEAGLGDRRSGGRAGRQCRRRQAGRGRRVAASRSSATPTCRPHRRRRLALYARNLLAFAGLLVTRTARWPPTGGRDPQGAAVTHGRRRSPTRR